MVSNSLLIRALKQILIERAIDEYGICYNLRAELLHMWDADQSVMSEETASNLDAMKSKDWSMYCFDKLFVHWPKVIHQTPMYPIEGEKHAYNHNEDVMWDTNHWYGALRVELCQFCIDYLEKQDDNQQTDSGSVAVN